MIKGFAFMDRVEKFRQYPSWVLETLSHLNNSWNFVYTLEGIKLLHNHKTFVELDEKEKKNNIRNSLVNWLYFPCQGTVISFYLAWNWSKHNILIAAYTLQIKHAVAYIYIYISNLFRNYRRILHKNNVDKNKASSLFFFKLTQVSRIVCTIKLTIK